MKRFKILFLTIIFIFGTKIFAQIDESKYFDFLQQSFTNKVSDDNEFLITQFEIYLNTFPGSAKGDEALFLLGKLFIEEREYFDALSCFAKINFLYPNSARLKDAKVEYTQIVQDHESRAFEDIQINFLKKLNESKSEKEFISSYFDYLFFFHESNIEDLNKILMKDINYYMSYFPSKIENGDQILLWQGKIYETERDWIEAVLSYKKLKHVFPNSSLIPEVLYRIAFLEYSELSKIQIAKEHFVQIITDFDQSPFAGDAQFYLAELYEKELDNKKEAITNYRLVVETFPKNKYAVESLKRVAEILEYDDKYEEAIASYYQIVELYPQDEFAPDALKEIKTLYVRKLENYQKAIETLKFYATQYQDKEDAAEMLFDAAEIYEDDLGEKQAAIDTYHQVINAFPKSDYAEKAKDRIEYLSEE